MCRPNTVLLDHTRHDTAQVLEKASQNILFYDQFSRYVDYSLMSFIVENAYCRPF